MNRTILAFLVVTVLAGVATAADPTATAVVCTGVKDRAPEGAAAKFPVEAGQLYCFTEAKGVADKVVHVWYYGDKEMRRVELPIKAERWRTWSVKNVLPKQTGAWKVEVQDGAGKVLATATFSIE